MQKIIWDMTLQNAHDNRHAVPGVTAADGVLPLHRHNVGDSMTCGVTDFQVPISSEIGRAVSQLCSVGKEDIHRTWAADHFVGARL